MTNGKKHEAPKLYLIKGGKKDEPAIDPTAGRPDPMFEPETGDYIRDVFGHAGYLGKVIKGYKTRMSQVEMSRNVNNVIRQGQHLIVEGPTGVGKSLAYAVPAAYHAAKNGLSVCIVTSNKTLLSQVYDKDLKTLKDAVPWSFTYSIRKGLGNYLCLRDWERLKDDKEGIKELYSDKMSNEAEVLLDKTLAWARKTSDGDRDLSPGVDDAMWKNFSTDSDKCDASLCEFADTCFSRKAKAAGNKANIIVTNYALLYTHFKIPKAEVLPGFDVVILDEAHRAAGIARDFWGDTMTYRGMRNCIARLRRIALGNYYKEGSRLYDNISKAIDDLWKYINKKVSENDLILHSGWTIPSGALETQLASAATLLERVGDEYMPKKDVFNPVADPKLAIEYLKASRSCRKRSENLADFRIGATKGKIYYLTPGEFKNGRKTDPMLESKMVDVSGIMKSHLFDRYRTVVQTSATLAIQPDDRGGYFDYLRKEMGMTRLHAIERVVPTPFDYEERSILVVQEDMPEYSFKSREEWQQSVCDHFVKIIGMVGGRTLGLFTSFEMLNMVKKRLRAWGEYEVLAQREGTTKALAKRFQENVDCVLLGSNSFAEGVSIEGEACSCVIVDKLPFIPPEDMVCLGIKKSLCDSGMSESRAGSQVFMQYRLPEAIIDFKQRVGRLIRTETDYGVAVLLDNRLHVKSYKDQFMKSVAFSRMHNSIDVIPGYMKRFREL
jgi:ATP-dependent DNA helicase DinG